MPRSPAHLAHEIFAGSSEPVLALHGISSTRKLWLWLHEVAPHLTLLAPDLRGRGRSLGVGERSYGLRTHVEDLVALLDSVGLSRVHVVGASLGAFVGVRLAALHPERVSGLTLVDGGLPMTLPPGLTHEVLPLAFGSRLALLSRSFGSVEEYRDHFCTVSGPLLAPEDPLLLECLSHDLDPDGRVWLDGQALLEDAEDVYFGPNPWLDVDAPIHLLHAEWSLGMDTTPAYEQTDIDDLQLHGVTTTFLPRVDHAGAVMTRHGASVIAAVVGAALT